MAEKGATPLIYRIISVCLEQPTIASKKLKEKSNFPFMIKKSMKKKILEGPNSLSNKNPCVAWTTKNVIKCNTKTILVVQAICIERMYNKVYDIKKII